jgi:hypothetical protein
MALTGFLISNACYPTSASALIALQAPFPMVNNGLIINATGASFTAPNTFNLSLSSVSIASSTKNAAAAKTMLIPMCDPAVSIQANLTPFDPVVAGSFFTIALVFTVGIWMVAKQGSEILSVLKYW